MSEFMSSVVDSAIEELARLSQAKKYFDDPILWAEEVLGAELYSQQKEMLYSLAANKRTAVKSAHSTGKALRVNTPIPTPTGWSTMGGLRVGDAVFDEVGVPCTVVSKSPVWHTDSFAVRFNDGTEVVTSGEHEWNVSVLENRKRGGCADWSDNWDGTDILTTEQMYAAGVLNAINQTRYRVPTAKALYSPDADLPIDPYVLGVWLGDGTATAPHITINTTTKAGIVTEIERRGYEVRQLSTSTKSDNVAMYFIGGRNEFRAELKNLGVFDNKHIPMAYLRASSAQRLDLLRGIMDADGFGANNSKGASPSVGIDMTNKELSENIRELILTLGWQVAIKEGVAAYTLNGTRHVTGTRYRMNFRPRENPFLVRSDQWADNDHMRSRQTLRSIRSIEKIDSVPTQCIQVDSPRHLYLATESFIPTHNSFTMGVAATWWVSTRGAGSLVVSTAPTYAQINKILWAEIRKHWVRHNLPGTVLQSDEWRVETKNEEGRVVDELVAFGRRPSDENESAFSGLHREKGVLFLIDEAVGCPQMIFTAAEVNTTAENCRILAIANPDNIQTPFGRIFKTEDPTWNRMSISVYDTPAWTGEKVSDKLLSLLPQKVWVDDMAIQWGRTSARFMSKIAAEFPTESDTMFFTQEDIIQGINTEIVDDADIDVVMGVDIARMGDDSSCIYTNRDGFVRLHSVWQKVNLFESASRIHTAAVEMGATQVRIDGTGVGAGVIDILMNHQDFAKHSYIVISMIGSGASPDSLRWYNARAWRHDVLRMAVRANSLDLDAADEKLHSEMMDVQYMFSPKGGIQIESKADMRKRGVKSPDLLDAVTYAVADVSDLLDEGFKPGDKVTAGLEDMLENGDNFLAFGW